MQAQKFPIFLLFLLTSIFFHLQPSTSGTSDIMKMCFKKKKEPSTTAADKDASATSLIHVAPPTCNLKTDAKHKRRILSDSE